MSSDSGGSSSSRGSVADGGYEGYTPSSPTGVPRSTLKALFKKAAGDFVKGAAMVSATVAGIVVVDRVLTEATKNTRYPWK